MENNEPGVFKKMTELSDEIYFVYDPHQNRFTFVNTAVPE